MVFYHIDHQQLITQPGNINLFSVPKNHPLSRIFPALSKHGVHYLLHKESDRTAVEIELILEYVRSIVFPNKPSRFCCLFAVKEKESLNQWVEYWKGDFNVVEIEADEFYELDASWFSKPSITEHLLTATMSNLNSIHLQSVAPTIEEAVRYWYGIRSNVPLMEVLIPLPCRVLKIEHYSTP